MMTQRLIAYLTWTLPLVMIFCPVQVYGVDSFCIAGTIPKGGLGRVSCHFNEDLSKVPQKDMTVYIYRVSVSHPEPVVIYSWHNGQTQIFTEPGYNCISNLTDHLEILINNATREHAGLYKCLVAPSAGFNQKTCTLIIEEGIESFCKAPSVAIGNRGMITCHFTEDLSIPPPKDLNVFFQRGSDTEEILVLLYKWKNGSPLIDYMPGYNCGRKLTDQLEITIDNTTKEHAGLYKCVVEPSKKHQVSPCTLQVMEEASADVTQNYTYIADVTQNYTYVVPIVLGCLVLLAAIIIIIIIIMEFRLWPQRWNNSLRTRQSASESEDVIAERESLQGNNRLGV